MAVGKLGGSTPAPVYAGRKSVNVTGATIAWDVDLTTAHGILEADANAPAPWLVVARIHEREDGSLIGEPGDRWGQCEIWLIRDGGHAWLKVRAQRLSGAAVGYPLLMDYQLFARPS